MTNNADELVGLALVVADEAFTTDESDRQTIRRVIETLTAKMTTNLPTFVPQRRMHAFTLAYNLQNDIAVASNNYEMSVAVEKQRLALFEFLMTMEIERKGVAICVDELVALALSVAEELFDMDKSRRTLIAREIEAIAAIEPTDLTTPEHRHAQQIRTAYCRQAMVAISNKYKMNIALKQTRLVMYEFLMTLGIACKKNVDRMTLALTKTTDPACPAFVSATSGRSLKATESLPSVFESTSNEQLSARRASSISVVHDADGSYKPAGHGFNNDWKSNAFLQFSEEDASCVAHCEDAQNLPTVSEIIREAIECVHSDNLELQSQYSDTGSDGVSVHPPLMKGRIFESVEHKQAFVAEMTRDLCAQQPDWTFTTTTEEGFDFRFDKFGHDCAVRFGPAPGHLAQVVQLTATEQPCVTMKRPFLGWSQMVRIARKERMQDVHIEPKPKHYDRSDTTTIENGGDENAVTVKLLYQTDCPVKSKYGLRVELQYVDDDGDTRTVHLTIDIEIDGKQ